MTLSKCYKVWANRWILNWVVCKQSPANELFKSLKSLNIGPGLPSRALGPDHSLLPSFLLPVQQPIVPGRADPFIINYSYGDSSHSAADLQYRC